MGDHMPALYRTVVPRLRSSLRTHGVLGTMRLSVRAPFRLLREWQEARDNFKGGLADPFDLEHNVETSQRVHQSDLATNSNNWVHGTGYWPTPILQARETLTFLTIQHEEYTFIDLGSGKGRILLTASDYPFARIIGVEYAPELHRAAVQNIASYRSNSQKCRRLEARCEDMTQFVFPETPLALFLYNPATEPVLKAMASNLFASLNRAPREAWIIYVTPAYAVFEQKPFRKVRATAKYAIYSNR
jgi:hypothetical protein